MAPTTINASTTAIRAAACIRLALPRSSLIAVHHYCRLVATPDTVEIIFIESRVAC